MYKDKFNDPKIGGRIPSFIDNWVILILFHKLFFIKNYIILVKSSVGMQIKLNFNNN